MKIKISGAVRRLCQRFFCRKTGRYGVCLLIVFEFSQQVKDLDVHPDQRDQKRKGAEPFVFGGKAFTDGLADLLVVDEKIERGNADDNQTEDDADWPALMDHWDADAEKAQDHFQHIGQKNAECSHGYGSYKAGIDFYIAFGIDDGRAEGEAEGQKQGIEDDAWIGPGKHQ